jgi:hypothetical protein
MTLLDCREVFHRGGQYFSLITVRGRCVTPNLLIQIGLRVKTMLTQVRLGANLYEVALPDPN